MMAPGWDSDCDFAVDQTHHALVSSGTVSEEAVHRASRHHNWMQSSKEIRAWTQAATSEALILCAGKRWQLLARAPQQPLMELVTHVALRHLRDEDLRKRILRDRNDAGLLKQAAREWHRQSLAVRPEHSLWLGERAEADAVSTATAAVAEPLHAVIAALGLWHFGELPASQDGAVLRVVYRIDDDVPLFKPDWRHGFPHFYFACAGMYLEAGRTRSLATGQLQCKEWIAKLDSLDARRHLSEAHCVIPQTRHCHYDLPALYWQNLASEITQSASGTKGTP